MSAIMPPAMRRFAPVRSRTFGPAQAPAIEARTIGTIIHPNSSTSRPSTWMTKSAAPAE